MVHKLEAQFVTSAAKPDQFPVDRQFGPLLPEIAFLGRSNVGKSSLLNALAGGEKVAFVSQTPGRTQLINFFRVGADLMFVDLPGYGYAKVPKAITQDWQSLIESYLLNRENLRMCVILLDARRGWMEKDRELKAWLEHHGRPYIVAATKIDKLTQSEKQRGLAAIRAETGGDIFPVSAPSGRGVRELWQTIWKTRQTNQ
jgi:GTP-binding protein